jgi:diguanylate cyclase (GGDEF)-like protein
MAVGGYDQVVVWLMADDQKGLCQARLTEAALVLDETRDDTLAWRAAKSGRMTFEGLDGRIQFGDGGAAPVHARAVPLVVGARVVGALEARHMEARAPSGEAVEILVMLAAHAATALESARVNQIAEEKSLTDPLTRLNNRRRLEEDLDDECNRCARYGRPLAFVMLDVDNFKAFNDTHGHSRADVALQEVAVVIGATARTTDSAYRYGGEEFCVLLRETGAENAMHFAERLRERIEARFADDAAPRITASFGVAEVSASMATPRALLEAADAAMYESKRTGRNRVVLGTPLPRDSSGSIAIAQPLQTAESGTVARAVTVLAAPERKTSG